MQLIIQSDILTYDFNFFGRLVIFIRFLIFELIVELQFDYFYYNIFFNSLLLKLNIYFQLLILNNSMNVESNAKPINELINKLTIFL